jgi:hypothetical protein
MESGADEAYIQRKTVQLGHAKGPDAVQVSTNSSHIPWGTVEYTIGSLPPDGLADRAARRQLPFQSGSARGSQGQMACHSGYGPTLCQI